MSARTKKSSKSLTIFIKKLDLENKFMDKENKTIIFSTGVHLQPIECVINEEKQWRWVAIGFEDESFLNGEAVNPIEYADRQENLVEKFKDEI
ncbi:MAG: hypothetical protein BWY26_01474 [Elusimicrobia bacterium ADurb.Bin231]|nr:MAG: hypothetical protein BWY26_01474 [Elusimicrobia bacterium ADurb.Bin231]